MYPMPPSPALRSWAESPAGPRTSPTMEDPVLDRVVNTNSSLPSISPVMIPSQPSLPTKIPHSASSIHRPKLTTTTLTARNSILDGDSIPTTLRGLSYPNAAMKRWRSASSKQRKNMLVEIDCTISTARRIAASHQFLSLQSIFSLNGICWIRCRSLHFRKLSFSVPEPEDLLICGGLELYDMS